MWRDYIVKLWKGVKAAEAEGLDLESILARFPLEKKYLYLKKMEQIIAKAGIDAAIKIYHKKKADPKNEYYFDERQFNTVGNRHCLFPDFGPKFWSVP